MVNICFIYDGLSGPAARIETVKAGINRYLRDAPSAIVCGKTTILMSRNVCLTS